MNVSMAIRIKNSFYNQTKGQSNDELVESNKKYNDQLLYDCCLWENEYIQFKINSLFLQTFRYARQLI